MKIQITCLKLFLPISSSQADFHPTSLSSPSWFRTFRYKSNPGSSKRAKSASAHLQSSVKCSGLRFLLPKDNFAKFFFPTHWKHKFFMGFACHLSCFLIWNLHTSAQRYHFPFHRSLSTQLWSLQRRKVFWNL